MRTPTSNKKEPIRLPDTTGQDRLRERPTLWQRYRRLGMTMLATITLLGLLLIMVLRFSGAHTSVDLSQLTIATVERGSFIRDVAADGQVVAAVSPTLYAPAEGSVTLKVHAGDVVSKGQVLTVVDSPDLTAKLTQEEATAQSLRIDWQRAQLDAEHKLAQLRDAYQQAEVDQKTAQREFERSRKAYELGAYSELQALKSQDALEKAQFAYNQAKTSYDAQPEQNRFDINSKKALLDRQQLLVTDLRRQVDALQIRSPVDGQVGQVQIADRASVAKDTPLLTVVDLSAFEVEIKVAESLARNLGVGMSAVIQGDRHWKGTVSGVSPEVVNGQVIARLRFDEKPEGLRQNQRLSVRIFIDRRNNVLMVDRGTFVDQDGGGFAYVVRGKIAERHPIRLGVASVQKVEILGGLTEGDRIVISGTDSFNGAERVILAK